MTIQFGYQMDGKFAILRLVDRIFIIAPSKKTTWKDPRMSEVDEMLHRSVTKLFAQKLVVKIDSISKTRYLHANVNGSPISILLDTGARSALISRSLTHPQNVFKVKKYF